MKRILRIFSLLPPYTNTIVVAIAIIYLTLVPQPLPDDTPELFPHADKVVHAILFLALGWAIYYDYYRRAKRLHRAPAPSSPLVTLAITIGAGALIEIAQEMMGIGRSGDVYDFIADTTGALIAYMTGPRLARHLID